MGPEGMMSRKGLEVDEKELAEKRGQGNSEDTKWKTVVCSAELAAERKRYFQSDVHVWLRDPATLYQAMERNLNLIFIADRLRGTVTDTRMIPWLA